MDIMGSFKKDLKEFRTAPFLFVGSGFSRRYIGLEDWESLLKTFCKDGMRQFDYYKSRSNSRLEKTASLMVDDFHEVWWNEPDFKESREQYKKFGEMIHKDSPLKYEIAKHIKNKSIQDIKGEKKKEIEDFKNIVIDGIITTNWDTILEEIFSDFDVLVGQKDLLSSVVQELAEIYKIHGSVSDFNSLILTEEDYKDFNNRNPYLAAKLLTIFIEHPIIFIGYSISDDNIIQILKSISNCLTESGLEKIKDNLYFVEPIFNDSSDKYEKKYINLDDRNLPITVIKVKDYSHVYKVLAEYERKLSIKQLKKIKSQIYEIVKNNDPNGRISTIDIDENTDFNKIDFVLGVGIKEGLSEHGYQAIEYDDLLEDVMLDNRGYDSKKIINLTIPQILSKTHFSPFYKYLRESNLINEDNKIVKEVDELIINKHKQGIERFKTRKSEYLTKKNRFDFDYNSLSDVDLLVTKIVICGKETINLKKLRSLILADIDNLRIDSFKNRSNLRKLIRIYDWLKFSYD